MVSDKLQFRPDKQERNLGDLGHKFHYRTFLCISNNLPFFFGVLVVLMELLSISGQAKGNSPERGTDRSHLSLPLWCESTTKEKDLAG